MQESHLADRLTDAKTTQGAPLDRNLDTAGQDDAEHLVAFAFAHDGDIRGNFAPDGNAQHFPQFDIFELGEKVELAQHLEMPAVLGRFVLFEYLVTHRRQILGELGAILVAAVEILFQRPPHDRIKALRQVRIERGHRRRIGIDDAIDQRRLICGPKWQSTGKQLEHDHTERIEVGFLVERVALDLFRRHVGRRTDAHDEGRVAVHVLVHVQGQAEIGDLRLVIGGDHDVGRLDVAMDDALPISRIECHAALEDDADDAVHGQQLVDAAMLFKAETVDVLHRQIGVIILDNGVVDLHDVRVIHPARDHAFILEELAHAARHGRAVLAETDHLDRDLTAGLGIVTEINRRRRPLAELANDAVFAYRFHSGCRKMNHQMIVARRRSDGSSFARARIFVEGS